MALQRPLRLLFACFAPLMLAIAGRASSPAQADDLFDEIYRRGAPLEASLRTVTAAFVETTSSTLLKQPLVARGTVVAKRPDKVRLHYTDGDERTVVVSGGTLGLDWPARSLRETRDIRSTLRRAQRFFADPSPAELRKHFDIVAAVATDRPGTWVVRLTPKRKQMRAGVQRLELWIDRETLLLRAMKMELPGGDTRLMEFTDMKVNPPVAPDAFAMPR